MQKTILITGGAGFIGCHTAAALLKAGCRVALFDDLSNGAPDIAQRIHAATGQSVEVYVGDIRDAKRLNEVFAAQRPQAVVHLAGLKSITQSLLHADLYDEINVGGTATLLDVMREHQVDCLVFSSSATIYGNGAEVAVAEDHPLRPLNPYGHSKTAVEALLSAEAAARARFRAISLRYFNPVGTDPTARRVGGAQKETLGLFPRIALAAVAHNAPLMIFGHDWATPDGTAIRDYVHVHDVAEAHIAALVRLDAPDQHGRHSAVNVGFGRGVSVLEAVTAFGKVWGRPIPHVFTERRTGDIGVSYADVRLAARVLNWRPYRGLDRMCRDQLNWAQDLLEV